MQEGTGLVLMEGGQAMNLPERSWQTSTKPSLFSMMTSRRGHLVNTVEAMAQEGWERLVERILLVLMQASGWEQLQATDSAVVLAGKIRYSVVTLMVTQTVTPFPDTGVAAILAELGQEDSGPGFFLVAPQINMAFHNSVSNQLPVLGLAHWAEEVVLARWPQ